ncbi:hypothetical protein ES705_35856 [subsurface metagenome]
METLLRKSELVNKIMEELEGTYTEQSVIGVKVQRGLRNKLSMCELEGLLVMLMTVTEKKGGE